MAAEVGEYRLNCQLHGHEDDVRGIAICGDHGIATSSRDRTVRIWSPDPETKHRYVPSKILAGHSSFVGPVTWVPPSERLPEGGVVSGGMDTLVLMWDLRTGQVMETMRGHRLQVTGLAVEDNGDVVSTSLDCTIRRWRKGHEIEFWEAHNVAVQAVVKLPSGELVTGSSDSSLKLWRGKTCLQTFVGHTDTVRGLAVMPDIGILSASHDSTIRLWALTGEVLLEMVGHTALVYSVDAHPSGLVASGSEDCFLKIWRDGSCVQSIEHPGCVWDVKFLENGDIVTACSDGVVRIWTSQKERTSDPIELESYAAELSQYKGNRKKIGGLKLADLPGLEALRLPGTTDGQTLIVREGDNGVAYSWNLREQKWDKIGEVVDGPGDTTSNIHDGVHYDFVFDVDIGDGEPIRKLPYNRGDNPYETADKWLLKENLPVAYRQQVVEFILQNTGQKNITLNTSFRDPYTGSSAYVPGQPSGLMGSATKPTFKHIPKKGMLLFNSAQFDGISKKIHEFNTQLLSANEQMTLALNESEMSRLGALVNTLKDTSHYHCSTISDLDVALLLKILRSWPVSLIFPGIDMLRMAIMHPDVGNLLLKYTEGETDAMMETFKKAITPEQPPNVLTIIRTITNLFKHLQFFQWLQQRRSEILDALSSCQQFFNKNMHLAYSSLLLNYALLSIQSKDIEGQSQVLSACLEIAENKDQDDDSRYRALVAIGTLMLEGFPTVKSIAVEFDVGNIAKAAKASKDAKIAEVGADIELLVNT